ncbi:hypothetical protein ACFSW8_11785 [Rubritalea tangerina]|uniref:Uncharacterized protein n=2 Tax=Rubritalea tangerina TaxID=430798 RepID=A0ABW4ZCI5_9BACT
MDAVKSWGVTVFVDANNGYDMKVLPKHLKQAFKEINVNYVPKMLITTPDTTQVVESFSYTDMKYGEYSRLFRDAKKEIRELKKQGALKVSGLEVDVESEEDPGVVKILNPEMTDWKSAKGSTINAKLLRIENSETFVFKNARGKEIKVKIEQLDQSSVEKANALVSAQGSDS